MTAHRIVLVDDHPLFRNALAQVLAGVPVAGGLEVIEAADLADARSRLAGDLDVDLMLLDFGPNERAGLLALLWLRAAHPTIPVVVISASPEPRTVGRSMLLGAAGFISKSSSGREIRDAVACVLGGGKWLPDVFAAAVRRAEAAREAAGDLLALSPTDVDLLIALEAGAGDRIISRILDIPEREVETRIIALLRALHVRTRGEAIGLVHHLDGDHEVMPALAV